MSLFQLKSDYKLTGDQPQAVDTLVKGIVNGEKHQTLLGVTGSGKTFTMANVIQKVEKPTLIIAHNKTLAAQLYGEFKEFFPTTPWNILSATTIITSLRRTSPTATPISPRTPPSTTKLKNCAIPPQIPCCKGVM